MIPDHYKSLKEPDQIDEPDDIEDTQEVWELVGNRIENKDQWDFKILLEIKVSSHCKGIRTIN